MKTEQYPALFSAADAASERAQRVFFVVLGVQLGIFLAVSAIGVSTSLVGPRSASGLWIITTCLLVIGVLLMWWSRSQRREKIWFDCRAVAESVKTATWRYMMHVDPFGAELDATAINKEFVEALGAIRQERPGVNRHLAGRATAENEITKFMRDTRALDLESRRRLYICDRLHDQKQWYERQATKNRTAGDTWNYAVFGIQVLALIIAIVRSAYNDVPGAAVSFLMTLSSSLMAWTQARRYEDVAEPYALAAHELRELETLAADISDSSTFEKLVGDTEDAISREHTMWRARRTIPVRHK